LICDDRAVWIKLLGSTPLRKRGLELNSYCLAFTFIASSGASCVWLRK
jgi:hypothetical protein